MNEEKIKELVRKLFNQVHEIKEVEYNIGFPALHIMVIADHVKSISDTTDELMKEVLVCEVTNDK